MLRAIQRGVPDIVIRPSGVWDTRAPFSAFLLHHRNANETFHVLILSVGRLMREARDTDQERSARAFFRAKRTLEFAARSWTGYKKSFGAHPDGTLYHPTVSDAHTSLAKAIPSITEHSIVNHCGLFETFCQCWALNVLLVRLEQGRPLNNIQKQVCQGFWPLKTRTSLPTVFDIGRAFPNFADELRAIPHTFTNVDTGEEVREPASDVLNAFNAIQFWRDWRNLLVHNSGIMNSRFIARHGRFFREVAASFPLRELTNGRRVSLVDAAFRAVATTHYRAAMRLRDMLVEVSEARRGHHAAPGPVPSEPELGREWQAPPAMLIDGDHQQSIQWLSDPQFRVGFHRILNTA